MWVFSYYSILASLMVDTDGQIMPFFFLLALIGYYKIRDTESQRKIWWGILLAVALVLGFLVKVSFLLAIGAIILDFLWIQKSKVSSKKILKYGMYVLFGLAGLALLLYIMKFIFPFFNLSASLKYWEHFAVKDRNWFQTGIQCVKGLLYSSPFLVGIPFLASKQTLARLRPFLFFLGSAFIFYVVLFDFSVGALDRYLQLLILPLIVLSAVTVTHILNISDKRTKEYALLGVIVALSILLLQTLPHYVPALHPKTEWVSRFLSLRWNFTYPFSGGSGPLGFYVSFLLISCSWIITTAVVAWAWYKPNARKLAVVFLIPIAFAYNGAFAEEYLVGFWNGHAPKLLAHAVEFIRINPDIKKVTVYNDNGGSDVQATGKYHRRLYVDPMFDLDGKVQTLNNDKMHYFVLDVPRLDPNSVYVRYFASCIKVYEEVDKKMSAIVYDCRNVPDIKR